MRILLLNSARKWIGEAAHTLDLYRELTARGHFVRLGVRRGHELERVARTEDAETIPLRFSSRFSIRNDFADWSDIRRIVRDESIEVVHCHRGKDHWLAAAALLFMKTRPALVRTRHVVTPARQHIFNRWINLRATGMTLAVSEQVLDALGAMRKRLHGKRARVVYSAVDAKRYSPERRSDSLRETLGIGPRDLCVGLVGRYQNIKGHSVFLEAARMLKDEFPGATFVVAGKSTLKRQKRLAMQAEEAGLAGRFHSLGFQQDLASLIASFDIGVCASLGSEGSSRITLEYLASGAPVVATKVGGIPEILREGKYGTLVAPDNAMELANAIGRLLRDEEKRTCMGRLGREMIEKEHNHAFWIQQIEDAYESAVKLQAR